MSIKKSIPNAITSLNLLCGVVGLVFAFKGRIELAFPLMLLAAVFDFFDGFAARLLDAYSDMGKELDSLADVVSFGVLPSVMLYIMMKESTFEESVWCYVPLLIAVFSGLRLAKFNVDERQHESFIGLPTPACAILCGALCYYVTTDTASFLCEWVSGNVFVPILSLVLCALLVCEVPMFSVKFSKNDGKVVKNKRLAFLVNCLVCVLVVVVAGLNWSIIPLLVFTVYILMNLAFGLFKI